MSEEKMPWVPSYPVEGEVKKRQEGAVRADSLYDYLCRLNIHSEAAPVKRTGIVCTIGPASRSVEVLEKLMEAGMTCARLNFSHGTHEYHAETVSNVRQAVVNYSKKIGRTFPLPIALDTKGPEIRTGLLEGGRDATVTWEIGDQVTLSTNKEYFEKGTKDLMYIDYERITAVIKPENRIYVEDGNMALIAKEVGPDYVKCVVEAGGVVTSQKGCNLPGVPVDLPAITEKDKEDIKFALKHKLDMIFASFIRCAEGVKEIRDLLGEEGRGMMIIPKIENQQGMTNIDEIIMESDGIMIARGDLAVEIPFQKVFLAQKMIIAKCNLIGKPVICATQMLESMTHKPRPTRAEATDVANAVLDGADCVMLSGESAKGNYPVLCVEAMAKICREAESAVYQKLLDVELKSKVITPVDSAHAIAVAASEAAAKCAAAAIVCTTLSGRTAQLLCRYRPRCPVICVTRYGMTARQLQMFRACLPLQFSDEPLTDYMQDVDSRLLYGINYGKSAGLINAGDAIVLVSGWRAGSGYTNTLRIVFASETESALNNKA